MNSEYLTPLIVLILGIIGHNSTVVYAVLIVLILKLLKLNSALSILGTEGLHLGVIILTAAILVPIVDGTINTKAMLESFKSSVGIVTILTGVLTAAAAGRGIVMLQNNPEMVSSLVIGTMAGVFFLKGVAVGPLIAAGFAYFIMSFIK